MTALAYLAAYWAASAAVLSFNHLYGILTVSLLANLSATMLIFLFSMIYNNSSTYDPYWSLIPPVLFFHWIGQLDSLSDPRAMDYSGRCPHLVPAFDQQLDTRLARPFP
jgi:hypothetical protein